NSIRARTQRLVGWLDANRPDVVCLQETKVEDAQFPLDAVEKLGYRAAIFGQKSYNGVAILSTAELTDVTRGFGDDVADDEFRVLTPDGGVWSWWDYRGVSFFKNQGLRIDHILTTKPMTARCTACVIDRNARKGQDASDHAPVMATFGL